MKELFKWIRNHIGVCIAIVIGIFLPIIAIHILFKIQTNCYWIQADWSSGDVLGYFGDVLAFLGTVSLGYVSLKLNEKAVKQNDKMIAMQHNQEKSIAIFDQEKPISFYTKNTDPILPNRLKKDGVDLNLDYITDTLHTRDIMIMEIYLKNVTDNSIAGIEMDEFNIVIDNKIIKPIDGLGDEISAFINEKGRIKLRVILTGLKSILSNDEWEMLMFEFEIQSKLNIKNIYNEKTKIKFSTGANSQGIEENTGKITYRIWNYEYEIIG